MCKNCHLVLKNYHLVLKNCHLVLRIAFLVLSIHAFHIFRAIPEIFWTISVSKWLPNKSHVVQCFEICEWFVTTWPVAWRGSARPFEKNAAGIWWKIGIRSGGNQLRWRRRKHLKQRQRIKKKQYLFFSSNVTKAEHLELSFTVLPASSESL